MNSLFSHSTKKGLSPPKKGSGLFSRSNSASSSSSTRVLSVAHQSTLTSDTESHLPLQPADIHLDLFTHSSSPCVRCQTCSQFLSVPDFMRHHHVAMDNKWLATEAEHRMLVPRNKENISELEKRLWEEFHRLQADIGGFGADEEEEDDEETESENELGHDEDDESVLDVSGTSSSLRSVARSPSPIGQDDAVCSDQEEDEVDGDQKSPHSLRLVSRSQKMKDMGLVKRDSCNDIVNNSVNVNGVSNNNSMSVLNLRTSSRKRKSKQLFSIENYP